MAMLEEIKKVIEKSPVLTSMYKRIKDREQTLLQVRKRRDNQIKAKNKDTNYQFICESDNINNFKDKDNDNIQYNSFISVNSIHTIEQEIKLLKSEYASLYQQFCDICRYQVERKSKNNSNIQIESNPIICFDDDYQYNFRMYKKEIENLLRRKFFVIPAFEIYGGVAGLYDLGPSGCGVKAQMEKLWRDHFILYDELLEINSPCLTPYCVLKASGHVDRFTDFMIEDKITKDCYRADKFIEDYAQKQILHLETLLKEKVNKKRYVSDLEKPASTKECILQFRGDTEKDKKVIINCNMSNSDDEINEEINLYNEIEKTVGALNKECIDEIIKEFHLRSSNGNELSNCFPFNLMFSTKIGPKDISSHTEQNDEKKKQQIREQEGLGYLRPETAQGIFVNFRRLLEYNQGRLPFGAAQIGLGFRNEIAPRNGLLRVREFQMAEIEYFVNPKKKNNYYKFNEVFHMKLPLYSKKSQLSKDVKEQSIQYISLFDAIYADEKIINNEILGYYLCRSYLFLLTCGIRSDCIRFRQHLNAEMAHYACDCWDAEIYTSYGWIECIGHADRSAYDLTAHSQFSKVDLKATEPIASKASNENNVRDKDNNNNDKLLMTTCRYIPNKAIIGKIFKQKQNILHQFINDELNDKQRWYLHKCIQKTKQHVDSDNKCDKDCSNTSADLDNIDEQDLMAFVKSKYNDDETKYVLTLCDDNQFELDYSMMSFEIVKKIVTEESFVPGVIEPSFGIGRILHCIFEHSFRTRGIIEQEERLYMALPMVVAPIKVCILPLSSSPSSTEDDEKNSFDYYIREIYDLCQYLKVSCKIDASSASIGKRYARNDELGIPFCITIDFETLKDRTVTMRDRDTMNQIRVSLDDLRNIFSQISRNECSWESLTKVYTIIKT